MSSASRWSFRSNSVTGFACSRRTGAPSVRMGTIMIRLLQMRLRFDAFDDPLDRQIAHRSAERGNPSSLEREQAYRPVSDRRDQRRERFVLGERRLHAVATGHAEHGGADRESGGGALLPFAREEPIG